MGKSISVDSSSSERALSFSWRAVERDFHNDNRLSWWLAHLSLPLA